MTDMPNAVSDMLRCVERFFMGVTKPASQPACLPSYEYMGVGMYVHELASMPPDAECRMMVMHVFWGEGPRWGCNGG